MTIRIPFTVLVAAVPLLATGCAGGAKPPAPSMRDQAKLSRYLDGKVAGPPQKCLDTRPMRGSEPVGSTIVLFLEGDTVWRNDLVGSCAGLRFGDPLVTRQFGGQLCQGDLAQTADLSGGAGVTGSCVIGEFVPYRPQ